MRKIGGLYVRGSPLSADNHGLYRDYKRLQDWMAGIRPTKEEDAAAIARAEASERAFQEWDKKIVKRGRSKR